MPINLKRIRAGLRARLFVVGSDPECAIHFYPNSVATLRPTRLRLSKRR
jgi:hypothetical protein